MESLARQIVSHAIERANLELPGFDAQLSDDLALFDTPGAVLDSLNLVSFVFILEEVFQANTGKPLKITTQDVLDAQLAPFRNVRSVIRFIAHKLPSGP